MITKDNKRHDLLGKAPLKTVRLDISKLMVTSYNVLDDEDMEELLQFLP